MTDAFTTRWNATSLRTKMTTVSVLLLTLGLLVAGLGSLSVLRSYLTEDADAKINNVIPQVDSSVIDLDEESDGSLSCVVAPLMLTTYFIGAVEIGRAHV